MKCECLSCVLTGKVAAIQKKLSPEDGEVLEQLLNEWAGESMEAGRAKSFLAGHWPGSKPVAHSTCKHEWTGLNEAPTKWNCSCGALVYRSYEDYCWD